jgi:ATP-dependent RNA helicase DDX35
LEFICIEKRGVVVMFWKPGTSGPLAMEDRDDNMSATTEGISLSSSFNVNVNANLSLQKQRALLPVMQHKQEIQFCVSQSRVVIVVGPTGSGKTTQIPQFLLEMQLASRGSICVTQPRRISAITLATRVAEEQSCKLGTAVGYAVRFEELRTLGETKILFATDGLVLRELIVDPLLLRYSVIMVDEAHERSVQTDLLLGLLKKIMRVRADLRVIISSATIEAGEFLEFFRDPGEEGGSKRIEPIVVPLTVRQFPVDVHYLSAPCQDYTEQALATVLEIHQTEAAGDILCFLTGKEEIDRLVDQVQSRKAKGRDGLTLTALPLYSALTMEDQLAVFQPAPQRTRRVIVSTNVAETSVTVPGVRYVIDCGFVKIRWFDPVFAQESLTVVPVSQASANQRAGRAGRVMPGKAYRLYTEESFNALEPKPRPEMQRSDLAGVVLQLKVLHVNDVVHFEYMSPPPAKSMARALETLITLGAIDARDGQLTKAGVIMAEFPATAPVARMLMASSELGVAEEVLSIAAMLSVQDPFVSSSGKQKTIDSARRCFAVTEGDHIALLNIYTSFVKQNRSSKWCAQFLLNHRTLERAVQVRAQLKAFMARSGLRVATVVEPAEIVPYIQKSVMMGFFASVAQLQSDSTYRSLSGNVELHIHPNSSLFKSRLPELVVYSELIHTTKPFINHCTPITHDLLLEVAGEFYGLKKKINADELIKY